ncbi:MAG: NAD(P)/FAD-dependent oxidoreductase [Thiotrichales bacterium]
MHHIIIGNGPSGVIAAETLRKLKPRDQITLIGDEPEPPYSRMAIPYLLIGNIDEHGTHLRKGADHFAQRHIDLVVARVETVTPEQHAVQLDNGTALTYDRLLIATGSHPIRPPVSGIDLPGVHTCWTLADARAIVAETKPGARVLQLGAGFIGCIIMEALAARGVELTVVEMGDRMVPRMMTAEAGAMIRRWVEQQGVQVHVNARVDAIEVDGDALMARLDDSTTLATDLVICAAGVRPNVAFLKGSGVYYERGVFVDEYLRTSAPDIYAAGDVTESEGFHTHTRELNAIQPNAADQARIAATNMAGGSVRAPGSLAINILDTLGLISTSFGHWWGLSPEAGGHGVELIDADAFRYLSLQFNDDVLIGATAIGWTEHIGVLRGLIQGRVRLGERRSALIENPTGFMQAYLAAAQAAA